MKKALIFFGSQMIPVMLGVYLGFALNNYGEQQKLNKKTESFRQMLISELELNIQGIQRVKPYHEKLKIDFQDLLEEENPMEALQQYNFMGLRPGLVNQSAFDTGIQTGIIQEFSLEEVKLINQVYTIQSDYDTFNKAMLSAFLSKGLPETNRELRNILQIMVMNMNDLHQFESKLLVFYEKVLSALNADRSLQNEKDSVQKDKE